MQQKISVCYPVYNEEENISGTLDETVKVLRGLGCDWEIVAVNDGSRDKTKDVLESYSKRYKNIRVLNHEKNRGYASASKTGMESATGDLIFIIDSDGQHTAEDVPKFVEKITEGYDIVVGWKVERKDPFPRKELSKMYNLIFRMLFRLKLNDVDCGFRVLTKDAAKKIRIIDGSHIVGTQMFAQAKEYNYKIAELPVRHFPRRSGDTIFKIWKLPSMVMAIFWELFCTKRNIKRIVKENESNLNKPA